ncbi:copper homeostasis protein CutC [Planctomonas sp. JC2975]|uniref:copper homeostasis protein CutC n=1 Tax=Planctomonas sp. JC2975 TaxID=2729626 RepID=UPI001475F1FC|nr:copper homeostasis protein CutC [Planctomonas sp. JC2975]
MTIVEIAVQDPAGARSAFAAGADRIELCQALGMGGLTPSPGAVDRVIEASDGPERIGVLVRPRGGGFVYDSDEIAVVSADIRFLVEVGITRMIVGALTPDARIDVDAVRRWREAAGDAHLIFHRAIDAVPDPESVVEQLVESGVSGILTSGGAERSVDGAPVLTRLVERAAGRLEVVAGGGIRIADLPILISTGVDAVHLSARTRVTATVAGPGGGADSYDATDLATVAAVVGATRGGGR